MRASSDLVPTTKVVPPAASCPDPAPGVWGSRRQRPPPAPHGMVRAIERESAMKWIKPAFDEIKMDAEAKSYSGEGFEE